MRVAKRIDVPLVVSAVGFLDVSAHQVFLQTSSGRTIGGCLAAELLPVFEP